MASYGRPPTSPRSRYTTPTRTTPATDTFYNSPLSRFTSPSSATSNFSFSPPSAGFLSLAGAAATTPLSSIDGGEIDCPSSSSSSTTADDRDQHEPLLALDNNNSNRPQKSQVAPALSRLSAQSVLSAPGQVDAVAPSATNTAAMTKSTAQSTISIRDLNAPADRGPKQDSTRAQKCTSDSNRDSYPASLSYDDTLDAPARSSIDNFPNESPVLSPSATTTTLPWSQSQPITSDLIRRVSSSRPIAHSTASPILSLSSPVLRPAPTLITTTIVQPKAIRSPSSPLQQQLPAFAQSPSSHGSPSRRTIISAHCSSVAQLEETAEHFANTGSIETAIREAHQELKRSDSRRSSILAAGVRQAQAASRTASRSASRAATVPGPFDAHPADLSSLSRKSSLTQSRRDYSRQSSIIGLNSAARTGAYTPHDYIMSPTASVVGLGRQRSASKASSAGDDSFPVLSRHGTGKSSVYSVQSQSRKQSLAEIVEHEPPMTITQDALDEADRRIAAGEDHEDDDTIRAIAHQHVGDDSYDKDELHTGNSAFSSSPGTDMGLLSTQTPSPMARPSVADYLGFPSAQKYEPLSMTYPEYDPSGQMHAQSTQISHQQTDMEAQATEIERPATSGSGGTFQQAQTAFQDFDGVHCDPDNASIRHRPYIIQHPDRHAPGNYQSQLPDDLAHTSSPRYKPHQAQAARPTSYMDPSTGQQMLFYPAPVPAMLNLPPKLSKNPKAAERNARRSQVLSMMMQNNEPKPERESRVWLPDPITDDMGSPLMDTFGTGEASPAASGLGDGSQSTSKAPLAIDPEVAADADSGPKTGSTGRGDTGHLRRPPRITDADKHKSRMSTLSKLPPQLRASAYFDHPSSNTNIQLKDGSATATLESILQASASAPVSAFTDHAFAGHLGSEVYGIEKKKRPKKASAANARKSAALPQPAPPHELRKSKSKGSFMSLVGLDHVRRISEPMDGDAQRPRRRLSKNFDGNLMAPDDDERASDEEGENDRLQGRAVGDEVEGDEEGGEEDEENEEDADQMYDEVPTTLLAELQIRKRQQKLRTRPINQAFPNGMHSTLLELDLVAEMERKARKGKRVNLAWEDPSLGNGNAESDDEDVPLGMLFAARAAGHNDISAVAAEINRPLGLLEKKQMEDNEPLSRRRERLQGRGAGAGMYLRPSHSANALRRQSMLTMTPSMMALNKAHSVSHPHSTIAPEDAEANGGTSPAVEEVEDEPLAARKLRIKAKEESQLPRARTVSMAFSEELLGQFVDPAEEEAAKEQEKKDKLAKSNAQPSEEEETLGQRRRRLQAEKDAREQEMGGLSYGLGPGPAVNNQALEALNGDGLATPSRLSRRLSMADVLAAHPLSSAMGAQNPREAERMRREQEAARVAFERDQKMAAIRAQMPHGSALANNGSGVNRSGGFLGGRFNDGSGGVSMQNQAPIAQHYSKMGSTPNLHGGMNTMPTPVHNMNNMNRNTVYGGYGGMSQPNLLGHGMVPNSSMAVGVGYGTQGMQQMPMQQMQMPMGMGGQMAMPMQMPMPIPGQPQIERVERWRQSIQP